MYKQSHFPTPPQAEARPELLRHLDTERTDPFYYMRDKSVPEVLSYLQAENAYTEEVMQGTKDLQETTRATLPYAEATITTPARRRGSSTRRTTATRLRPSRQSGVSIQRLSQAESSSSMSIP